METRKPEVSSKSLEAPLRKDAAFDFGFLTAGAAADVVRKSIAETWNKESRRNIELAAEKVLQMWEVKTSGSEIWLRTAQHLSKLADSAKNRAYRALGELMSEGLIDAHTAMRARTLIEVLFTPNTIYSSIGPDDGGLTMYWPAGDMAIEIDIFPGEGYWWRVRNVAGANYSGNGNELPIEDLKYSLTWFSKEVDRANPHWRNQRS